MKRTLLYSLLMVTVMGCQDDLQVTVPQDDVSAVASDQEGNVKGEIYIKFASLDQDLSVSATRSGNIATEDAELDAAAASVKATRIERVFPNAGRYEARTRKAGLHLWYRVVFDERISVLEALESFGKVTNIVHVESVPKIESESVNDPYFEKQWYLQNPGTEGMVAGCDVNAVKAWEIEKGKPEVVVAVVDTPIDLNHEDLKSNLWINVDEYNQYPYSDADNNGYQGDWYGLGSNPYLFSWNGWKYDNHGTHVAGIIAAKNNNNKGVCGIAGGDAKDNGVRIMCCNLDTKQGGGSPVECIKYAADNGAVICSNSWNTGNDDNTRRIYQEAVDYFVTNAGIDENGNQVGPMRGGLVFASAGNNGKEEVKHTPASLNNVIAVAAIGPNFKKANYSNYAKWVDISAPGGADGNGWQIFSTLATDNQGFAQYGESVGTSMATPAAAAVAALIVSKFARQGLTPEEVELRLLRGAKSLDQYNPDYVGKLGAGCVDAVNALDDRDVNFFPVIKEMQSIDGQQIFYYGDKASYEFSVSDKEDGTDVKVSVSDPSEGAASFTKEGDKLLLTIENRNCLAGDCQIVITVTDKADQSRSTSVDVKLLPENLKDVAVSSTFTNELVIRASMTFSGSVNARFYDVNGNLALEKQTVISLKDPGKIDTSSLKGGFYTLKLTCNNKTIVRNIIKL